MKALPNTEYKMKTVRPALLITLALMALSLGVVGCKHKPQKTTTLLGPGSRQGITGDERNPQIGNVPALPAGNSIGADSVNPASLVDPTQGFRQPDGFEGWYADHDVFKDQTVLFDYDKHNVKPSEVDKLREVARRMKNFPGMALRIEGHCDERGTEEYNRSLGDRRAQAIREFLATEGFDPGMMPTITFGEDKPADPGHTDAAFTRNRRGELVLLSARPHSGGQLSTGTSDSKVLPNSE